MPAQPDDAGDQITGGSPLTSGFGHPCGIRVAARPDATLRGRTKTQRPLTVGALRGVERIGEVAEQRDLLAAHGHVDDDAVARVLGRVARSSWPTDRRAPASSPPLHAAASTSTAASAATATRFVLTVVLPRSSSRQVPPQLAQRHHRGGIGHRLGGIARLEPSGTAELAGQRVGEPVGGGGASGDGQHRLDPHRELRVVEVDRESGRGA